METADGPTALNAALAPACFVCGGAQFDHVTPAYRRCTGCGHETLAQPEAQAYIVNDVLSADTVARPSLLDQFQGAVLRRWTQHRSRRLLVDIGSGSGKFLFHHGRVFDRAAGIEITPEAVNFSRNTLQLHVVSDIAAVTGEIDTATAWHSLEHFPSAELQSLLIALVAKLAPGGCLIVSVPNAASFQSRFFRRRATFFDVPNHLHQFTPDSLTRLLAAHGFVRRAAAISWPYNAFGYAQSLLNCAVPGHNHFYYRVKRGRPAGSLVADALSFALLPFAALLALPLTVLDAVFPARAAVLTWCFEKRA